MSRYFYIGILAMVVAGMAGVFLYRTNLTGVSKEIPRNTAEFGGVSLRLDYATTSVAREKGLGGRAGIERDYGMLFVFPIDAQYGFWMKDTLVPLDIFWLDESGRVVFIARDVATSSYPTVFYPSTPARYVLETSAGFARAHQIATGTPLSLKVFPTVSE